MARPSWNDEMRTAAIATLDSKHWVKGHQVQQFGKEFAEYCGVLNAAPCQNGSSALWAALKIAGIGPGDEVIVPSFTFISTATCIVLVGAQPVFVDVDPDYFCLNLYSVKQAMTPQTKAVIGVHLFGQPYDSKLIDFCEANNLLLIEDAAQAHGAQQQMADGSVRVAGAMGDVGCFSFFPSKNMAVGGEGGMLTTTRQEFSSRIQSITNHGRTPNLESVELGSNLRMSEVAAAIGRKQLSSLDEWVQTRRNTADRYAALLENHPLIDAPGVRPNAQHAWHQYCVQTLHPEALQAHLDKHEIDSRRYYTTPIHQQQIFANHYQHETILPETAKLGKTLVAIPVMHELIEEEKLRILAALETFQLD